MRAAGLLCEDGQAYVLGEPQSLFASINSLQGCVHQHPSSGRCRKLPLYSTNLHNGQLCFLRPSSAIKYNAMKPISRPLRYSDFKGAQGNIKCHNPACLSALAESRFGICVLMGLCSP